MSPETLGDRVEGFVHRETQVHDDGVDLTAAAIRRVTDPGRVDFGGGELTDASAVAVEPTRRSSSDDYGWWRLTGGRYLLTVNESLSGDGSVLLQPRVELCERGAAHPTLRVSSLPRLPLAVPQAGIRLKENARVSTLVPE